MDDRDALATRFMLRVSLRQFYLGELDKKDAEIERLRKQCEGLAQSAMNNGQDLLLKEAEIERLRAKIVKLVSAIEELSIWEKENAK